MSATMAKRKSDRDRHLPYKLVRIQKALYDRLRELADRHDRPLTRELRRAIEAHLKAHEQGGEGE
jgi:predicted DNA-binding protein